MKRVHNFLLLLTLLLVLSSPGCTLTQPRAAKQLHHHKDAIRELINTFPTLVDSLTVTVHDTITLPPKEGGVKIVMLLDTSKYQRLLQRYVDQRNQMADLVRQADVQTPTPASIQAQQQLAFLRGQLKHLRDSLQYGAYRDSTYRYEDSVLIVWNRLHNGELITKYTVKTQYVPYISHQTTLDLTQCPIPPFWSYWQFWAACSGYVLIGLWFTGKFSRIV